MLLYDVIKPCLLLLFCLGTPEAEIAYCLFKIGVYGEKRQISGET